MPRWAAVSLSLVLFAAAMLAVRAVLHATVPGVVEWLTVNTGIGWAWVIFLALMIPVGIYGYWPRHPDGTAKPLLSRRR